MFLKRFLLILFLIISSLIRAQIDICDKAGQIIDTVQKYHYSPRPLNQEFSHIMFDYLIDDIDSRHIIFSKEDYNYLKNHRGQLNNYISEKNCSFIDTLNSVFYKRLTQLKLAIEKITTSEIKFTSKDSIVIAKDQVFFSEKEKLKNWEDFIKMQVLVNHFSQDDSLSTNKIRQEEIVEVIDALVCMIDANSKDSNLVYNAYLNAIAKSFDPHSNYFSLNDKESFDYSLSKEIKSFGIEIQKNDLEQIEIASLVPGGPAWKSNLLNEKDVILSVSSRNKRISFTCVTLKDAFNIINSPDYPELTFEVLKQNGKNQKVSLVKEVLDVNENLIQSFVLEGDKKIGYIYLPSFYSEMSYGLLSIPNGCANDISKELFKLKREGIEGLILDVRNNGGGSMLEAIRLSGVFIDYGAIAIIDTKGEDSETIKDMDRGMAFSKPLIILVNETSASASELFAATMQDHNRGVVVGSKSFGKATMQTIIPLSEEDFLKTTVGKFYRVTGKSHQKIGIAPDITLPSYYNKMNLTEGMFSSALSNSEITHKTYYYPFKDLPIAELKELSRSRVENNKNFEKVSVVAEWLYENENNLTIPLNYNEFKLYYEQKKTQYKDLENNLKNTTFTAHNPVYLSNIREKTVSEKTINKRNIENIENDITIVESFNIILDLINHRKKK